MRFTTVLWSLCISVIFSQIIEGIFDFGRMKSILLQHGPLNCVQISCTFKRGRGAGMVPLHLFTGFIYCLSSKVKHLR